jgi:hypothetical protein
MGISYEKIKPIPRWAGKEVNPFTREEYKRRIDALKKRAVDAGVDVIVLYADKLHFGDIDYFTGLQIKWEEALFVVSAEGNKDTLILGNECFPSYPESSPVRGEFKKILCPSMSLPGMLRFFDSKEVLKLSEALKEAGLAPGKKTGLVGWKCIEKEEFPEEVVSHYVPHVFVRTIADVIGTDKIPNLSHIMIDPEEGLRVRNDAHMIAHFEMAASKVSNALVSLIEGLKIGMSEADAASLWKYRGERLSADPVVMFGQQRIDIGFPTASENVYLEKGQRVFSGIGYDGAFVTREGRALEYSESQRIKKELEEIYIPYFRALKVWYETVKIGESGAVVYDNMRQILGSAFEFNPGHQIDRGAEWTTSLINKTSPYRFQSGMAIQMDIITMTDAEDGIVLADEELRKDLEERFPECWKRIQKRKAFLEAELGIHPDESLLPLSNIQARVMPCLFSPEHALVSK